MKARAILEFLGMRAAPKIYGYRVDRFELERDGTVELAQWLHPKCRPVSIDQPMLNELRSYIAPGDVVVDVGAHMGDTTVPFALAAGPTGHVFAVEPNRYVLPVLEKNAGLNSRAAPITVLPYAAVAEPMNLVFDYSDPGFCNGGDLSEHGAFRAGHLYKLEVEGRNIPREIAARAPELASKVAFIKTDTEGNDRGVVETFRDIIMTSRPYLLSEVYRRSSEESRLAFHRLLTTELRYRVFRADPYRQLRGEELGPDDMTVAEHFDILCIPAERAVT